MIDPTQLDFALPDGTALRDASGAEIRRVGEWLLAVAANLRPEENADVVGEWSRAPWPDYVATNAEAADCLALARSLCSADAIESLSR